MIYTCQWKHRLFAKPGKVKENDIHFIWY